MGIKQDDLIRLWEWCGWEYKGITNSATSGLVYAPRPTWQFKTGEYTFRGKVIPNYKIFYGETPDLDLTALYQFAIPKLQDKGYIVKLVACEQKGFVVQLESCILMERVWEERANSPTEALFNAIMKVIDSEMK